MILRVFICLYGVFQSVLVEVHQVSGKPSSVYRPLISMGVRFWSHVPLLLLPHFDALRHNRSIKSVVPEFRSLEGYFWAIEKKGSTLLAKVGKFKKVLLILVKKGRDYQFTPSNFKRFNQKQPSKSSI